MRILGKLDILKKWRVNFKIICLLPEGKKDLKA